MKQEHFGETLDGTPVKLYKLSNGNGLEVAISTYGSTIVSLLVPDRRAVFDNGPHVHCASLMFACNVLPAFFIVVLESAMDSMRPGFFLIFLGGVGI
jgi:hypothetical protein